MTPTGGIVDVADVRDYLALNPTAATSQYTDATLGSNILAAQSVLEQLTGRYLAPRTFTTQNPWVYTTMLAATVPLPGFRSVTTITWGGSTLVPNQSCWLRPDVMQTGVFTGIQFRANRSDAYGQGVQGTPYGPWVANSAWFDQAADSPFYPGNLGGGSFFSSMPNDLSIVGEAGFDPTIGFGLPGSVPYAVLHAVKVLAGFYTMRPASILADVAITPAGGVITYSQMPAEVRDFIATWKAGQPMMVST